MGWSPKYMAQPFRLWSVISARAGTLAIRMAAVRQKEGVECRKRSCYREAAATLLPESSRRIGRSICVYLRPDQIILRPQMNADEHRYLSIIEREASVRLILLLAGLCIAVSAQSTRTACNLSPSAEKTVRALPSLNNLSLSWAERIAPRHALTESQPNDWPLQFHLQDALRRRFYLGRDWDTAISMYRRLLDRLLGELLEARLTGSFHRKQSRAAIERVLQAAPDSPWAHLAAAEWASHPINRDAQFGSRHLEEFRRLCPENPRAFELLDLVQDAERLAQHVQDLRKMIDAKKRDGLTEADLSLFRAAWPWEKVAAGGGGEAEFHRRVRSDLAAIQSLERYESTDWYSLLRFGSEQILKNPGAMQSVKNEVLQRAPRSQAAWWIEEERATKQPPAGASREQMEQWRDEHDRALRERIAQFESQPFTRIAVHSVLLNPMSKLDDAETARLADLALTFADLYPDEGASWPPVQLLIAEVYARRKLRLDRVPALVQRALEEIEYQEKHRRDSDAIPSRAGLMDNVAMAQSRAREVLIQHAIATEQMDKAKAMLADLRRTLEQTKPPDQAAQAANLWRRDHHSYLSLAKAAGIEAAPVAELLPIKPEAAERFPVGDFEAKDLSGRTWRLSDLKGKVAYVNVWTTWCMPCRGEMPGIQKLHERWKERKDRVVLTISADFHEAIARDFLREYKYTFPVIHGSTVAEKFFPPIAFPQNWLIDPEGRRLSVHAPRAYDTTVPQIEELADKIAAPAK